MKYKYKIVSELGEYYLKLDCIGGVNDEGEALNISSDGETISYCLELETDDIVAFYNDEGTYNKD